MKEVQKIYDLFKNVYWDITSEMKLHVQMNTILCDNMGEYIESEYLLSKGNRIDFYLPKSKIGIELKIKGSATEILNQCKRYCDHDEIEVFILATAKYMGFPEFINGKPCYLIHLTRGML